MQLKELTTHTSIQLKMEAAPTSGGAGSRSTFVVAESPASREPTKSDLQYHLLLC